MSLSVLGRDVDEVGALSFGHTLSDTISIQCNFIDSFLAYWHFNDMSNQMDPKL